MKWSVKGYKMYCGIAGVVELSNGVATEPMAWQQRSFLNWRVEGVERGVGSDSESILSPDDIKEIVDNIMEPILWWRTW